MLLESRKPSQTRRNDRGEPGFRSGVQNMTRARYFTFATHAAHRSVRLAVLLAAWPFRVAGGGVWRRRVWKALVLFVAALVLLLPDGDVLNLPPAERIAARYRYDLVGWEVSNLPAKWIARAGSYLPWLGDSPTERRAMLDSYMERRAEVLEARSALDAATADPTQSDADVVAIQDRVDRLVSQQQALRNGVEELLESVVSGIVKEQGLNVIGDFVLPPVDARLDRTPHLLVTSPRDRIERLESVLLSADSSEAMKDTLERQLLEQEDLSAVVVKTGGVATYPTVIPDDAGLERLLELMAHEWLHTYLFFHPLGQGLFNDGDMLTLNETLANMFGDEVGRLAYERLTGERLPEPPDPSEQASDASGFDFNRFMHGTRLRTDELLAAGDIEDAERYMEERRVELNSHGYNVRKINQAWFAFHGTYADSPASVSPVASQLEQLREQVPEVGELVKLLRGVPSFDGYQELLSGRGVEGVARVE